MSELQSFNNSEFGEIRTVIKDGEPMFCLADVCKALGLTQPSKVKERLTEKGVNSIPTLTAGGEQKLIYINEANLYKTIFQSRKESAERFTDWVTSEVIPSIRRTGSYGKPMTTTGQIQLLAQGHVELEQKIDNVQHELTVFKEEMPLLGVDMDLLQKAVNARVVNALGGIHSNAYNDKSIRNKVYSDCWGELKRQCGYVKSYKELKRNQVQKALAFIDEYELPDCLLDAVTFANNQMRIEE